MALVRSSSCARVVRRISPALTSACSIHTSVSSSFSSAVSFTSLASVRLSPPRRGFAEQQAAKPATPPFENQKPKIVIYASNVAIITGDNPYGSIAEVFEFTWQKSFPGAWAASKSTAEEEKGETIIDTDTQLMEDMKALGLSDDFAKTMDIATKPDGTTQVIYKARRAFEDKLAKATGTDYERRNRLLQFTRSKVNKTFGANNEGSFIKDFEFKTNIQVKDNNQKFFKMELGVTSKNQYPWYLGGRIDGFHNGRLIEIKNRVSRVFNVIPGYDNIQFQCYLQLLNLEHGDLLQRLKSDPDNTNELATTIHRDDQLFKTVVIPRLQNFCDFLEYFLSNPRFGVEYMTLPRKGQEQFLQDYLKLAPQIVGKGSNSVTYDDPDVVAR